MVMHARKLPRINDGFSEKHQAHGYENSKYSSNKFNRYGNHEKNRDSPSTNSLRSSSPDSRSQSPRYHKNTNYYKIRDKERDRENRERDRDRDRERERDYRERGKPDGSRSPKDRRRELRERERERDHRDSRLHERINSVHKKEEKPERLMQVGDWSEHVSSSGKKYYYNCQTQVSQWEKPSEWYEWERNHRGSGPSVPPSGNHSCKESTNLHRGQHDKNKHSTISDGYRDIRDGDRDRRDFRNEDHYDRRENRKYVQVGTADMDISSGDSTPTSESHHARHHPSDHDGNNYPSNAHFNRPMPAVTKFPPSNLGPLTASLPNSLPGASNNNSHMNNSMGAPPTSSSSCGPPPCSSNSVLGVHSMLPVVPQLLNSHPRLLSHSSTEGCNSLVNSFEDSNSTNHNKHQLEPLTLSSNNIGGAGPPTPTHSENHEGLDIRKIGSPNSSLNTLQSLTQNATNSLSLTPSLANYYKESLISHVQSWPTENIEKQCHRLSEEAHTIGSLIMTKVSADLKMARSLVRLAEIQATLHEQRILFLRDQKKELEDMKAQNCFMNDT